MSTKSNDIDSIFDNFEFKYLVAYVRVPEHTYPEVESAIIEFFKQRIETTVAEARIDENHRAMADFHPKYLIYASPRKKPHLTETGLVCLAELQDRHNYHQKRIEQLTRNKEVK